MNFIKKAIIALMVVLTAAGAAEAKIIGFGIKAGLNVNKISSTRISRNPTIPAAGRPA